MNFGHEQMSKNSPPQAEKNPEKTATSIFKGSLIYVLEPLEMKN